MGQIVRALEAAGPLTSEDLARTVGTTYWESGRHDRALAHADGDGLIFVTGDGTASASG
ncbi:MAG: hypothetical protein ACXWDL_03515 [Nocardioides sp.]